MKSLKLKEAGIGSLLNRLSGKQRASLCLKSGCHFSSFKNPYLFYAQIDLTHISTTKHILLVHPSFTVKRLFVCFFGAYIFKM